MKQKYFRIIELPEHDVLLQKDWDEENDAPVLDIVFFVEGVRISQKLGYEKEEQRDKAFEEATYEQVQNTVDAALKMIG